METTGEKGKSPKGLQSPHQAKPDIEVPEIRVVVVTIRGTQVLSPIDPTTATKNRGKPALIQRILSSR